LPQSIQPGEDLGRLFQIDEGLELPVHVVPVQLLTRAGQDPLDVQPVLQLSGTTLNVFREVRFEF
jgi:hypothetical protein